MISNQAYIHPDAKLGKNVTVEPFAYIAGDVVIGDDCWIGPGAVIHDGARIGKGCKIHTAASIACTQKNTCRKGNSGLLNHSFLHLGGLLRQNDLANTILNFNGCAEISRELF